jgi:hypothetical protein
MIDVLLMTMLGIVGIGGYCAFRLDGGYPLWLRLMVLSPSFTAMFAVYYLVSKEILDCYALPALLAISLGLLSAYIVLANALSHNDNRWFRKWHNAGRSV